MAKSPNNDRYIVKSLVHASRILNAFESRGEVLRLRDIVERTGFNKGMCFRLLYTLHSCGFLEKLGDNQYRLLSEFRQHRKHRIGYAAQGQNSSFPREVQKGLIFAAESAETELLVVDNRYDAKVALRNAERLIREQVELVIEFQTDDSVAASIAAKYMDAGIPMIAIDIPHPGATYFGANNYEAGLLGGRHLGRWARRYWDGNADELLLIGLTRAGALPQTRIRGMVAGVKETLRIPEDRPVTEIDGDGQFNVGFEMVRNYLRKSRSKRILVGAANDPSALGALRAFEAAGRAPECAVVGQNCEPEVRAQLRRPGTRLIGSVAYFPEKYGAGLIRLALDILTGKPVPPAVFMKHQLVTPEDVDDIYPNDQLLGLSQQPV
jgi:ribose transport system substrate-binding protein